MESFEDFSIGSFSGIGQVLKSIHHGLFLASVDVVEIFVVGTKVPKGVPRPVVKSTMCHPLAARVVAATRSLPGAESRLSPFFCKRSP